MTEVALTESLGRFDVQRKSLELEGEAIISELTAKPESGGEPMGIDTPLVDRDGYPRGDIDVYRARELRQRLAVVKTDRKELMKQIDTLLEQLALVQNPRKSEEETKEQAARAMPKPKPKYDAKSGKWVVKNWDGTLAGVENGDKRSYENLNDNSTANENSHQTATIPNSFGQTEMDSSSSITATTPPFAKIDGVANLSPASEAGLKEGDLITQFGSVNHTNHQNLRGLMPIVTSAADAQQAISVTILRQAARGSSKEAMRVSLVPKPWPGRGLIGCHIILYSEETSSV